MKNEPLIKQLNQIAQTDNSWKKDVVFYEENKDWLELSADIAIRILSTLRANKTNGKYPNSQKQLAELMGISSQQINKILKGNENLTLKTINKIEKTLNIRLIELKPNEDLACV
ncbi:helix-turn-helix transcriptional regulator [Emticicia sp. W12TSBA100-4]|uniref:helix-turn-helix transcriptional regulator n=1 Tax=Emticicia sp. W12TSBA100-4 TaxID=3160965 RepID=UPI00330576EF